MVGDLLGGQSVSATFSVKISKYAAGGVYTLPLQLSYQYLNNAEQISFDTLRYWYYNENITVPIDITIKPGVTLDVTEARAEQLNVGTEGYVIVRITNAGSEFARNAVAKLARDGQSPLVPTDASVYIGDFGPGETREIRFKASVSSDAEAQDYPVDIHVDYTNSEGDSASSDTVTVGVPVGKKIQFSVASPVSRVNPGERVTLEVVYQNTGSAAVYHAEARISAVDPFTSNDDTAYLGDLAPGQTGTARYEMTVDSGATPKRLWPGLRDPVPGCPGQQPDLGHHQGPGRCGPAGRDPRDPLEPPRPLRDHRSRGNRSLLYPHPSQEEVMFSWDGPLPPPRLRTIEEIRNVLMEPACECREPLYFMYRDLSKNREDGQWLRDQGLRYDITVIPARTLCGEYVKTKGHHHPVNGKGVPYPEIYEVLEGEAHYLLQTRSADDVRLGPGRARRPGPHSARVRACHHQPRRGNPCHGKYRLNPLRERLLCLRAAQGCGILRARRGRFREEPALSRCSRHPDNEGPRPEGGRIPPGAPPLRPHQDREPRVPEPA